MNKVILGLLLLAFSAQANAQLKIDDSRQGALVYGFLATLAEPQNAGDGVLLITAEVNCTLHKDNGQHYCMSDIGGITGDIAGVLYDSFSDKSQEDLGGVSLRSGTVSCASIEKAGTAPRYTCY